MQTILVVVRPFGSYVIGDFITASDIIAQTLASDHAKCVVRMVPPAGPPAAAAPTVQTGA